MDADNLPTSAVRLRLDVSYDGAGFSGWARQPGLRTVQGVLELALSRALRLPAEGPLAPLLTVAGRTDTGVHARGQVCHVAVPADSLKLVGPAGDEPWDAAALTRRLNRALDDDVVVRRVSAAPPGFDARFSAVSRRYAYRVCDVPSAADPLQRGHVLQWPRRLDEDAMNASAEPLIGEHDFAVFCRRREGATTVRALQVLGWERAGAELTLTVVADAFCHHMVRSLVGCLIAVGEGRRPTSWPGEVLVAGVRDSGILVVPAHGLTLEEVRYPPDADLAVRAAHTRRRRS